MDTDKIKSVIRDTFAIPGEWSIYIFPGATETYIRLSKFMAKWNKGVYSETWCLNEVLEDEDITRALFDYLAPGITHDFAEAEANGPPMDTGEMEAQENECKRRSA